MDFLARNPSPALPLSSRTASHEELEGTRGTTAALRGINRFQSLGRRSNGGRGCAVYSEVTVMCFYTLVIGIVLLVGYATVAVEVPRQPFPNASLVDGDADSDCNFEDGQIYGVVVDNPAAFIDSAKDRFLYFERHPQLGRSGRREFERPLLPFFTSRVKVCRMKLIPEHSEFDSNTYSGVQLMYVGVK